MAIKTPKRIAKVLMDSLKVGVVPRIGLENVLVGREAEIDALLSDIETIKDGGASFRLLIGKYGSGKTFLLQTVRNYALDKNYVVVDADLSPERRLAGTNKQGLGTYRELMKNLSTKTKSEGGALQLVVEKWISIIKAEVCKEYQIDSSDSQFYRLIDNKISETIESIDELVHGYEFGKVIQHYWKSYRSGDDEGKQMALRWMRGEYSLKSEATKDFGIRNIIDDDTWYDYLKVMAIFIVKAGYKGLIIIIDETVNLSRISNTISRANNYEKLLMIFNDTMQGKAQHLGFILCGTPLSLTDTNKGIYSYEALKSRLVSGKFKVEGYKDFLSPIINLDPLSPEELVVLTEKLAEIHEIYLGYKSNVTEDDRVYFIKSELGRVGADKKVTPREIIRDFIEILNITKQLPETRVSDILNGNNFKFTTNEDTEDIISDEFEGFEL